MPPRPKRASLRDRTARDTIQSEEQGADHQPSGAPPPSSAITELWGEERNRQEVVELALHDIMPNRRQPRQQIEDTSLEELAESIRTYGVLQPIIVRPITLTKYEGHGCRYELIAGHRRYRASELAGQTTIAALIRETPTAHSMMLELALIENIQRQDLHPLDEATALAQMQDDLHYSYEDIAQRIGKSKAYIVNRMRLLKLPTDLRDVIVQRPDTIKHVYELAKIADPVARKPLIDAVLQDALSRAETHKRVQEILVSQETASDNNHDDAANLVSQETNTNQDSLYDQAHGSPSRHSRRRDLTTINVQAITDTLEQWEQLLDSPIDMEQRLTLFQALHEAIPRLERIMRRLSQETEV